MMVRSSSKSFWYNLNIDRHVEFKSVLNFLQLAKYYQISSFPKGIETSGWLCYRTNIGLPSIKSMSQMLGETGLTLGHAKW